MYLKYIRILREKSLIRKIINSNNNNNSVITVKLQVFGQQHLTAALFVLQITMKNKSSSLSVFEHGG